MITVTTGRLPSCLMADAPARFKDLCLDARDHQTLADWWCAAMGYVRRDEVAPPEEGWARPADWPVPIVDRTGGGPPLWVRAGARAQKGEKQGDPHRPRGNPGPPGPGGG